MKRLGTGSGVAALFNTRAARVTPQAIRLFRHQLPDALVLVSQDVTEARAHVKRIIGSGAQEVFAGGGDGTATLLVNLFREESSKLPRFGFLPLGSGNAWARSLGARPWPAVARQLQHVPRPLPTRAQPLIEVEGRGFPFAGLGWDARLLYASPRWLRTAVPGWVISAARQALAGKGHDPAPEALIERSGGEAFRLDQTERVRLVLRGPLYSGAVSMVGASTIPEHGLGLRAFPFARKVPGRLNLRVTTRSGWQGAREVIALWRGTSSSEGIADLFVDAARLSFSRPLPLQLAGEPAGERTSVELKVTADRIEVLDWEVAAAAIRLAPLTRAA